MLKGLSLFNLIIGYMSGGEEKKKGILYCSVATATINQKEKGVLHDKITN